MAHNEELAGRIRDGLSRRNDIVEKKMFGGVGFLLKGNLLVGVWKESLVVRLGAERAQSALGEPHVRRFDITGRPMKGWILVDHDGMESDEQFERWINDAVAFVSTLPAK